MTLTRGTIAKTLGAAVIGAGIIAAAGLRAESKAAPAAAAAKVPQLTPQDYFEIEQLVSSYPYGLDENTDNGESYAKLFAPGAVFTRPHTEGHDNLAALANGQPHGAHYTRHFITNHVIEPAPGGAIGKEYAVIIDIPEPGRPGGIALGGRYDDEYVKTPQGWRFKTRTFTPSHAEVPPPPPGRGRGRQGQQTQGEPPATPAAPQNR